MNRIIAFGLFAVMTILLVPLVASAQKIGELDNRGGRYIDGCGSPQIWPKGRGSYGGNGVFYVVPNNNGDGALMNLDGRVVNLSKESGSYPGNLRKGSTFIHVYKGGGYVIRINYIVTKVDRKNEHGGYSYSATITATKGKTSSSVRGDSSDSC